MRAIYLIALTAILTTGCVSKGDLLERNISPSQNYRLKGSDQAIKISGKLDRVALNDNYVVLDTVYKNHLNIFINDVLVIDGTLNASYFGEVAGSWGEKQVTANCAGQAVSRAWVDVRCLVLIDNEKTVTLTF